MSSKVKNINKVIWHRRIATVFMIVNSPIKDERKDWSEETTMLDELASKLVYNKGNDKQYRKKK